jgi:hypothetical protein
MARRRTLLPHFYAATSKMASSSTGVLSRLASRFYIELCADAANEFRHTVRRGSIPVRKSRLPVCTASASVPNGLAGATGLGNLPALRKVLGGHTIS